MRSATLSLKGRALRLLAMREHSRLELARKLAPHAPDAAQLDALLDDLVAKDFINEARAAESVLHSRAAKLGTARLVQELRQKGIPDDVVQAAKQSLQRDEAARAQVVWQKKFGIVASNPSDRLKQCRFLQARGFSPDVIRQVLATGALQTRARDDQLP
jgi:regulatory protein